MRGYPGEGRVEGRDGDVTTSAGHLSEGRDEGREFEGRDEGCDLG